MATCEAGVSAVEALVMEHLPLARKVARQMNRARNENPEDIEADALVGLWEAARSFCPERVVKFSTYAQPRIFGAIQDGRRGRDHFTRTWRSRHEAALEPGVIHLHQEELRRSRTYGERDLSEIRAAGFFELADGCVLDPLALERTDSFKRLRKGFPIQDRLILLLYYREHFSMAEIGEVLGTCESRISQRHARMLQELRYRCTHYQAYQDLVG